MPPATALDILLIGSGGREHALAWRLAASPSVGALYASPGSAAMAAHATRVELKTHADIIAFAQQQAIDLVVVGPEAPLVAGLADELQKAGIAVFGPSAAAARLEGSKAFSKDFMARHNVPTAAYAVADSVDAALAWIDSHPAPLVVKADGLAAGKGVSVCATQEEARQAVRAMLADQVFGAAGARVVLEAFLKGQEASFFVITNGRDYLTLPACQDHKTLHELDRGPNTGGMGAYCPAPLVTPAVEARVRERIVEPVLARIVAEGHPYRGVLYVGLMIDPTQPDGEPRVVEFNCRFGDPECQTLMMMLEGDLAQALLWAAGGRADQPALGLKPGAAAVVVMASGGYPGKPDSGHFISGLEQIAQSDTLRVFHAGTSFDQQGRDGQGRDGQGRWINTGGRVLGITAQGDTLQTALNQAYAACAHITWKGAQYRRDIGMKALKTPSAHRPKLNVGIVLGSASDLEVARKATEVLTQFGLGWELAVASAHRTPGRVRAFIQACEAGGAEVFIAMAGMAAALPGVVAAETIKPVIGVPVSARNLQGLDALLSIAQMPPGIPVATVAVDGAQNAGVLAVHMLAIKYPELAAALAEYRMAQAVKVAEAHQAAGLSQLV